MRLQYNGALAQVTSVLSGTDGDTAEKRLYHKNKGCCYATIISMLLRVKDKVKGEKEEDTDHDENGKKEGAKKRSAERITLE